MDALSVLQRLGRGTVIGDLVDALAKAAEEVVETGKPATVALTLKVSTKSIGDPFVAVEETIARSSPKKDPKGSYFFAVDGELHRDDPRQARIDFRSIGSTEDDVRSVAEADAAVREVAP